MTARQPSTARAVRSAIHSSIASRLRWWSSINTIASYNSIAVVAERAPRDIIGAGAVSPPSLVDHGRELGFGLRAGERGAQDVVASLEQSSRDACGDANDRPRIGLRADGRRDLAHVRLRVHEVVQPSDEIGLRADAVVQRLHRHAGVGRDVLQARRGVALRREPPAGGLEDVMARLLGLEGSAPGGSGLLVAARVLRHNA